jgi:hypothetical protein
MNLDLNDGGVYADMVGLGLIQHDVIIPTPQLMSASFLVNRASLISGLRVRLVHVIRISPSRSKSEIFISGNLQDGKPVQMSSWCCGSHKLSIRIPEAGILTAALNLDQGEPVRTRTPHFCTRTPAHPSIKSDMINARLGIEASYMTPGL